MTNHTQLPAHRAIIEDRIDLIKQLKDSPACDQLDQYGFTPLDLARFLGRRQCEEILEGKELLPSFRVQFKDQNTITTINLRDFEKKFHIAYRPSLTFPSYQTLQEVIRNCPYFFRLEWIWGGSSQLELQYQTQLSTTIFADTYVKWIHPTLGYGLFAASDIPEHSFVGEYTGMVRQVARDHPKLNGYCFHYPTRFWSANYFVIDALHEGNLARFINHSSQPNLQPLWLVNRRLLHLVLIANQSIPKGSELTFNYGADYWLHRKKISH